MLVACRSLYLTSSRLTWLRSWTGVSYGVPLGPGTKGHVEHAEHAIGARAEKKVTQQFVAEFRKVEGKNALFGQLASALVALS